MSTSPPAPPNTPEPSARGLGRRLLGVGLAAGLAYGGVCALMFVAQRRLLFHPTPANGERSARLARVEGGASGDILYAEHPRAGERAMLYLGGNAEDPAPFVRLLAQQFSDRAVYGLHYPGYAGSSGEPSEVALRADAAAWFAHLRERHPRLTLIGRSLGTALALRLAADDAVERVVLITPYDSIAEVAAGHYPWLPARWLVRDRFEAWKDAARVRAPTLLLLAEHDAVTPAAHGQALHRHFAPGVAQLRLLAGTDHGSIAAHPEFLGLLRS